MRFYKLVHPGILLLTTVTAPAWAAQPPAGDGTDANAELLLADASARESLTLDAEEKVTFSGYIQSRYIASHSSGYGDKDWIQGFQVQRIRLGFKADLMEGVKIGSQVDYAFGKAVLLDSNAVFELADTIELRIGQFKLPYTRANDISSSRQQALDRSITHGFFDAGRSEGVMLTRTGGRLRLRGALSDGAKETNGVFSVAGDADIALTGRAEVLAKGDWGLFKHHQSWRGGERGLMFGSAVHFQNTGDTGSASGASTTMDDRLAATLDASLMLGGGNVFCAVYLQNRETASGDFFDWGASVQGGVFVSERTEAFARWDAVFADDDRGATGHDLHSLTAGVNYFFIPETHTVKITVDIQHTFDGQLSSAVSETTGRVLLGTDSSQTALRAQLSMRY